MAKKVLTDVSVSLGGNDISDHVESVTIDYKSEAQDATAMGDGSRVRLPGLKDWSATLNVHANYSDNALDEILFNLVGTVAALIVKPTSASVSANNPSYSGNIVVESYSPLTGGVGDLAKSSVSLPGSGTLIRAVS
ncbi:MAG: hypothetical protein ABW189_01375 [Rickettsiales bacterium]